MKKCARKDCPGKTIKRGSFNRKGSPTPIARYSCKLCLLNFSDATSQPTYRQHKRHLNRRLSHLLCSAVTQRRCARLLGCTRKTVAIKLKWLAEQARLSQARFLKTLGPFDSLQLDELETFEHSKCKPLSVPLVVTKKERFILALGVASMPAKGHLAKIALKKYGLRKDDRPKVLAEVLASVKVLVGDKADFLSDRCPRYPGPISSQLPQAVHQTVKGRRGCVVGQGELKRGGFDPLFSLNHTCATARASISRLVRRTWATTKKPEALADHLAVFTWYHNRHLLAAGR